MIASLSTVPLQLEQPKTSAVIEWGRGGSRTVTSREAIVARLAKPEDVGFELWFSADVGVGCSFRVIQDSVYAVGFDLWGLESGEVEAVSRWALDRFRTLAQGCEALLLVIDPTGTTVEFDWNDFVTRGTLPSGWPNTVGVQERRVDELGPLLSRYRREPTGCCFLFFKSWRLDSVR